MNLVFDNRHLYKDFDVNKSKSFLKDWVMVNTRKSLKRYFESEKEDFKKPLKFSCESTSLISLDFFFSPLKLYPRITVALICIIKEMGEYKENF
jgi:hypothetical protein